ncbi:MAG: 4Fe-4S dicluster domain-containing protein [Planctomycetes bacterium]|nr:4Fe-4S dicluster domain-containing protein [Planctomycetota bacterium]
MSTKTEPYTWKTMPRGSVIPEAGNASGYRTGSWRTYRPVWNPKTCIHCLTCWILCPDSSIQAEGGKVKGIDYDHCKGCGICAHECPINTKLMAKEGLSDEERAKGKAITMVLESEAEKAE